jgi:two-component system, chemotaxis family, sensor kinase CheA
LEEINEVQEESFLDEFIEEAKEHIGNIEVKILEMERDMNNKEIINSVFRSMHTLKGLAGFVAQIDIEIVAHKSENILSGIRKNEFPASKKVIDLILATIDYIRTICNDIKVVKNSEFQKNLQKHIENLDNFKSINPKIGEILKEKVGLSENDIENLIEKQKEEYPNRKLGEVAVIENMATAKEVIEGLRTQEDKEEIHGYGYGSYVKIPAVKLEEIADMLGEIMTLHLQITKEMEESGKQNSKHGRMEKIIKEIQTNFMEMRMVSLKPLFNKLSRIARDTAKELNIDINIEILGEDEETDRNIAEKLFEPMLHLVKNSLYHGLYQEDKNERNKNGKRERGTLKIEAVSNRGIVYLTVEDDGKGIDIENIYRKALKEKLADSSKKYSEQDIIEFIFKPGFTTCESANKISGRGFGLDIVKTEIQKIGGKIETVSKIGSGTKFIIKVPINMAVINGTVIIVADEKYILPTSYIKEIIKNDENINFSKMGQESMVKIREKMFNVIDKKMIFGTKLKESKDNIVVILEYDGKQLALKIDNVIERREVVVKQIGDSLADVKDILGGTILGDGKVALILDVESFFKEKLN